MTPTLSVILCAHNPRPEFLGEALAALRGQTLDKANWEFLLIDNASKEPLAGRFDLAWHPQGRHILETELGLTPARLRGMSEARGGVLVFVDDDNILDPTYLAAALQLASAWPKLGAWGGQIRPRFEVEPPAWTRPAWGYLAIRQLDRDLWSNLSSAMETFPCGAGMCVRSEVALRYAQAARTDPARLALGRRGAALTSGEDTDIALTAHDMGLGTGVFTELGLTHIMPRNRLEEAYLLRLAHGIEYSLIMVESFHGKRPPPLRWEALRSLARWYITRRMDEHQRKLYLAKRAGRAQATHLILNGKGA